MSYYIIVLVMSIIASRFIFPLLIKVIAGIVIRKPDQNTNGQTNKIYNGSNYNNNGHRYNNYNVGNNNNNVERRTPGELYEKISVFINFSLLCLLLISENQLFNIPYCISILQQLLVGIIMTKTNGSIYNWIFRIMPLRIFGVFNGRGRYNNQCNDPYNNGYSNNNRHDNYPNNADSSRHKGNNQRNGVADIVASATATRIVSGKETTAATLSDNDIDSEDDDSSTDESKYVRSYPGLIKDYQTSHGREVFPINGCSKVMISPSTGELIIEYKGKILVNKLIKYCDGAYTIETPPALMLLFDKRLMYPVVPIHINDELVVITSEYGDSLINAHNQILNGVCTYDDVSFFTLNSDRKAWIAVVSIDMATTLYTKRPVVLINDVSEVNDEIVVFNFSVEAIHPINISTNCNSNNNKLSIRFNTSTLEVYVGDTWIKCNMGVVENVIGSSTKYGQLSDRIKDNALNTVLHPINTAGVVKSSVITGIIAVTQKVQPYMMSSAKNAAKNGTLQEASASTKVKTGIVRDGILNDNNIFNYIYSLGHFTCTVSKAYLPTLQSVIVLKLESDADKSYVLNKAGESWITIDTTVVLKEFKSRIINIIGNSLTGCINWWLLIGEDLQFVSIVYNLTDNADNKEDTASRVMSFIYSSLFTYENSNGVIDFIETITPIDISKIVESDNYPTGVVSTQKYFNISRISFSYDLLKVLGIIEVAKDTSGVHDIIKKLLGPSYFNGSFSNAVKLSERLNPKMNCNGRVVQALINKDRYYEILDTEDCLSVEIDSNVNPMKLYDIYSEYESLALPLFGIGYFVTESIYRMNLGYCVDNNAEFKEVIDELFKTPLSVALFSNTLGGRVTERTDVSLFIFCKRTIEEA